MADADWDAEDFEPAEVIKVTSTDKWEGEDEDDMIKDNWDDEDEPEKQDTEKNDNDIGKAVQVKKKKPLAERIAEKEAQRQAQREAELKEEQEARKQLTPEEQLAEKLRVQKLQEDADLELAKGLLGTGGNEEAVGKIDGMEPSSREEFEEFAQVLKEKICKYEKSQHYVGFLEILYRELSLNLEADDLKKLGSSLNALSNEKVKVQKASKGKKKSKKATLAGGRKDNAMDDFDIHGGDYNEFDDFM